MFCRNFQNQCKKASIPWLVSEEKIFRSPYGKLNSQAKSVTLTERQILAVDSVVKSDKTVTLIHGVTGSGKTEVYLSLINKAILDGKTAGCISVSSKLG